MHILQNETKFLEIFNNNQKFLDLFKEKLQYYLVLLDNLLAKQDENDNICCDKLPILLNMGNVIEYFKENIDKDIGVENYIDILANETILYISRLWQAKMFNIAEKSTIDFNLTEGDTLREKSVSLEQELIKFKNVENITTGMELATLLSLSSNFTKSSTENSNFFGTLGNFKIFVDTLFPIGKLLLGSGNITSIVLLDINDSDNFTTKYNFADNNKCYYVHLKNFYEESQD